MKREAEARLDHALLLEMGVFGLIAADLPERYGGLGEPQGTPELAIEAHAYGDINVSFLPLLASLNGQIIARQASPELAGHWIPHIVSDEALVCIALTEPCGGSDGANLALSRAA